MYLKARKVVFLMGLVWCFTSLAMPPVEFLQSCKNSKPANNSISMTLLDGFGSVDDVDPNCVNRFDAIIQGVSYGALVCKDKPYLIIADKKISTSDAENLSMNSNVGPNIPINKISDWWRIDQGNKSYLCIQTSLSDTGSTANSWQYYLVEDAFNVNLKEYKIYYYFFDMDVSRRT